MNLSALLTSAGINTAICFLLFSIYSILRKQPSLVNVYFGQRLAQVRAKRNDPYWFGRLVPSASWIVKAWEASEDELCAAGGLDAVVFLRLVVFSIRIFCIAAIICLFMLLPLNYYGQQMQHNIITTESLAVFTIENIKDGSQWLWAHCFALYVISCFACFLLYYEYKAITQMRLVHITSSLSNPCYFTILVRGIPWSRQESYSDTVAKFFTNYYASSYLTHQIIYQSGTVQKLLSDAGELCHKIKSVSVQQQCGPSLMRCGLCGGTTPSFKRLASEHEHERGKSDFGGSELQRKECAAAFVFFRSRYAALIASQSLQSSHPMQWVTDPAPEPRDVHWSNLGVPFKILWVRRICILIASIVFVAFYLVPVWVAQSLVYYEKLQEVFPFMRVGLFTRKFIRQLITGYLPSVVLMLFLYLVPPLMFFFSTLEGPISRSDRKRSACIKVFNFVVWNVFIMNLLSGSVYDRLGSASSTNPREIPSLLARAVPAQAKFFMTYIMTSGWASLSCELIQPFGLLCNFFYRFILRNKDESSYGTLTFPYHIEAPRVLLLGLLGFTCSIFAPLILPILLIYFLLAYLVYRNQILNVYETKYESGGLYWPFFHKATIFSLVVTQFIALGVFGLKKSTVASSFTIPLIICTLFFNEYCRQRFDPIFKKTAAQVLIEMDRRDEMSETMEEMYLKLQSAYCQFSATCITLGQHIPENGFEHRVSIKLEDLEDRSPAGKRPVSPPPLEKEERRLK